MTETERLLHQVDIGELLLPSTGGPSLVDLASAISLQAGSDVTPVTDSARQMSEIIGPSAHLVFILVDGLGQRLIGQLPVDSFLRSQLVREMQTVFPSGTATALTSLATGAWPDRHGVTGWWTYLPGIKDAVALLPFLTRPSSTRGACLLTDLGVTPADAFLVPPLMGKVSRDSLALLPIKTVDSISSVYFTGGQKRSGYRTLHEAVNVITDRVLSAQAPSYTYFYTPHLDEAVHRHGLEHERVLHLIHQVDHELGKLAHRLSGRARIVVTADHGMLDIPVNGRHKMGLSSDLMPLLCCPPSGDARVLYFHTQEFAKDSFRERFLDRYSKSFILLSVEEAESLHILGPGPTSPEARARFGSFIAIAIGADVIEYVPTGRAGRVLHSVSHHSGLTPDEMLIPLIVA